MVSGMSPGCDACVAADHGAGLYEAKKVEQVTNWKISGSILEQDTEAQNCPQ